MTLRLVSRSLLPAALEHDINFTWNKGELLAVMD